MAEAHSNLTTTVRKRLQESAYISSLPAFSGGGFFLLRLEYRNCLAMTYSTGRDELDRLSFPLGSTLSYATFVHTPIRRVSSQSALSVIMQEDFTTVRSKLEEKSFFQSSKEIPLNDGRADLFREQILLLELFFNERRATSFGCPVKSLDDVFWIISGIYVFGVPFAVAILSGNSFDKEKFDLGQESLPELLSALIVEECEDSVFGRLSNDILDGIREGRTVNKAVMKPVAGFLGTLPWQEIPEVRVISEVFRHRSLGEDNLAFEWPEFFGIEGYPRKIVDSGRSRFRTRLGNLLDGIEDLTNTTRARLRSSVVAGIASQSLSHNIGSHALSDARLFDASRNADGEGLKDFHQYLQGRMDYVAQLIARTPPQPEPMYLWQDVLCEFFRQRLLLNRLVADRSVEGRNLSFKVIFPEKEGGATSGKEVTITWKQIEHWLGLHGKDNERTLDSPGPDVLVAIPGGSVGRHALYSILENMMRNSVKYGGRRRQNNDLCIHFRLRDPDEMGLSSSDKQNRHDYWLLEIWDNFSGFPPEDERFRQLAKSFTDDVIDEEGKTRPSGHGLIEIKEAMRFLHGHDDHKDENDDGVPYACVPDCHRTSPAHADKECETGVCHFKQDHCCHANLANVFEDQYGFSKGDEKGVLVYRVRLRRPRMLGVLAHNCSFDEKKAANVTEGVFFRNGMSLTAPGPDDTDSLADLAPHLLVIRDDGALDAASLQNGIVKEIAEQHWRLPFRLFVIVENEARLRVWKAAIGHWEKQIPTVPKPVPTGQLPPPFLPTNRLRVLIAPDLHEDLAKPHGNPESGIGNLNLAFVNRVYDHWLMAYKPLPDGAQFADDAKWHLAVCFQRDKQTIEGLWAAAKEPEVAKLHSLSVAAYFQQPQVYDPEQGSQVATTCLAVGHNQYSDSEESARRLVHFGNHGVQPEGAHCKDAIEKRTVAYSQEFSSSEAPRTFNALYAPPKDIDGFVFFALSVLEAALTTVAIFDERALSVFISDGSANKVLSPNRTRQAALGRLCPLVALDALGAEKGCLAITDLGWAATQQKQMPYIPTAAFLQSYPGESAVTLNPLEGADILVLHEGLIEELVDKKSYSLGSELCHMRHFPWIVRTSGKGRDARKLDLRLPFVEYSALSAVLAPYMKPDESGNPLESLQLDKIMLAKSVLNSVGHMKKENDKP